MARLDRDNVVYASRMLAGGIVIVEILHAGRLGVPDGAEMPMEAFQEKCREHPGIVLLANPDPSWRSQLRSQ